MINLNNFPPNQGPNTKRLYSISLQKLRNSFKAPNTQNSLNILQKNIQFLISEKFNSLVEGCKKVKFINRF